MLLQSKRDLLISVDRLRLITELEGIENLLSAVFGL
jgi:hypothetical protein